MHSTLHDRVHQARHFFSQFLIVRGFFGMRASRQLYLIDRRYRWQTLALNP